MQEHHENVNALGKGHEAGQECFKGYVHVLGELEADLVQVDQDGSLLPLGGVKVTLHECSKQFEVLLLLQGEVPSNKSLLFS